MRKFLFILVLLALAKTALTQVGAMARVDSNHLLIGDQVKLRLEVTHPVGTVVATPDLQVLSDTVVEFLQQSPWDTLERGASIHLKKDVTFTFWAEGEQTLPAIPVPWSAGGRQDTAITSEIPLTVATLQVDTTLADIKPIIREPLRWTDYFWHYGYLVALGIIGWLVVASRMGKKYQPPPPPPPPVVPPHEIALKKLAALKNEKLWQQGQVKTYYSELSYIVREYLENRYAFPALEAVTEEILEKMRKISFNQSLIDTLAVLLQNADLVKFAKADPPIGMHEQVMEIAEKFVFTTREVYSQEAANENLPAGTS
jgi:hypothetical protein